MSNFMSGSKSINALPHRDLPMRPESSAEPPQRPRRRVRVLAKKPVKPGDSFGVPGQGSSLAASMFTILALFGLWFAVTNLHLMRRCRAAMQQLLLVPQECRATLIF